MKRLEQFVFENEIMSLNENMLSKLTGWFKNLFKTQETLLKENKPISINVDTDNIKGPEKPCELKEIISNKEEMNLITNIKIGFPMTSDIIKNSKKYLFTDDKQEYKPQVNRFFYIDGKNTYAIAYSMFDTTIEHIEGYANILDLDVLQSIENLSEIQKFVYNKLESDLKKLNKKGLLYSSNHPRLKPILTKLGFTTSKENNQWLIKVIK